MSSRQPKQSAWPEAGEPGPGDIAPSAEFYIGEDGDGLPAVWHPEWGETPFGEACRALVCTVSDADGARYVCAALNEKAARHG